MMNKTFASLAVASALGLLTPTVQAFGLGKLELHSALNEPFNAEISVTTLNSEEAENLEIRLASNQEFEKAGLERSFVISSLEFKVIQKQGVTYISVNTEQAVKEPILDFLVIATTGEGRLIREYTVLLDPPKSILSKPKKQSAKKQSYIPPSTSEISQQAPSQAEPERYNSNRYGPTDTSDTLWNIAIKTRPEKSLSVNQMMVAILEANPDAFLRRNINGLKTGYTLDIPSIDTILELNKSAATAAVREQNTSWKNRNKKTVEVEPEIMDDDVPVQTDVPTELDTLSSEDEAIDSSSEDRADTDTGSDTGETSARLKLVVPSDETSLNDDELAPQGDDEIIRLSEQLTFAQETIEAQAQENIDFKERLALMEDQLETMRRLISLTDPDLARLQSLLQEVQETEEGIEGVEPIVDEALAILNQTSDEIDVTSDEVVEADIAAEIDEQTTSSDVADYFAEVEQRADAAELEPTIDELAVSVDDEVIEPETESEDIFEAEVDEQPEQIIDDANVESTVDSAESEEDDSALPTVDEMVTATSELMDVEEQEIHDVIGQVKAFVNENKMTSLLGSLLILLAIWLIIRRRNRPGVTWDEAVEKYDVPQPSSEDVVTQAEVESESIEDELEEPELIDLQEDEQEENVKSVDELIEQSDMFVGYADYTQAKSSLEQAMLLEPNNNDVIAKLLFVLYKEELVDDFITLVRQSDIDSSSEQWSDIAEWGRALAPENELFDEEEILLEPEEEEAAPESEQEALSIDETVVDAPTEEVQESEHLEFNLDDYQDDELQAESADDNEQDQKLDTTTDSADDELMPFDSNFDLDADKEEEQDTSADFDAPLTLDISDLEEEEAETETTSVDDELTLSVDEDIEETVENETLDVDEPVVSEEATEEEPDTLSVSEEELEDAAVELDTSSDVEFDMGDFDEIDEAETKLDLAAAYIDMGDPEGAKNILEEVQKEGNDEQQSRAKKLLDDLSE